jgi:Putative prokaryotic signal transducing protein
MDDLVRVAVVGNEPEAELTVSFLGTEGIRAMWRETSLGAMGGVAVAGAVGGPIEVLVHPEDAERAMELLAEAPT